MYPLFISGPYESLENDSLNLIPVHIAEGLLLKKNSVSAAVSGITMHN